MERNLIDLAMIIIVKRTIAHPILLGAHHHLINFAETMDMTRDLTMADALRLAEDHLQVEDRLPGMAILRGTRIALAKTTSASAMMRLQVYPRDYVRHNENSRSRGGRPGRAGYRGRGGSRRAADRDFLQTNRAPTPELMSGIDEDKGNGVRYRAMDEMSVSDEDENDDTDGPRKKRARSDAEAADGNSVPQWSNPDPYTALPPPDESQRKKKDVVKLIRKARVTDGADGSTKPGADSDDFISFDFDDDVDEPKHTFFDRSEPVPSSSVPINTPTGPKASAQRTREDHPPRPVVPESLPSAKTDPVKISMRKQLPDKPMRNAAAIDLSSDPALGNRKRTHQDEIKLEAPRELNNSANMGLCGFKTLIRVCKMAQDKQNRPRWFCYHRSKSESSPGKTTAISLNPPAYVPKDQAHNIVYKRNNMDKFSIIDPNKPDNDISGGASNTRLQSQPERAKESILGCILAGNYRSFDIQRSHLATVHEQTIGPVQD
ncbi:hypothetical protein M7I_1555 [Glarea lozoyensis 74030]|uniref:Uncharacterized protein n=1 Tax=Glarea lozoyensis (strain ATCC 74030 / MF5533) TaxID=1104152 RepID=H0EGD9_GLAL7|nr:hypothetical protein M7I_1555 [Glarea lozoyensis 74030]